jgi:hypothetical protein
MTVSRREDPATDAAATGAVGNAALFVTFYVSRERASTLHGQIESLVQTPVPGPDGQGSSAGEAGRPLLGMVYPPAAHDATAIRLILNAPGDASVAWEAACKRLEAILDGLDPPGRWWGYTMIYQAVVNGDKELGSALDEVLPAVRRVGSPESLRPLARADLAGGRAWLVDIPQQGDGKEAATVCVALSPPDAEDAFKKILLGPRLLMADLIAHKGYFLKRQYRGDRLQQDYKEELNDFWEAVDGLLDRLSEEARKPDRLNKLARHYRILVGVVSKLNRISVSMGQQLHNYGPWLKQMEGNSIVEYHHGYLEMASRDLELMVTQGKDALEVANTAMNMTQVEIDNDLARRQILIGDLLAVTGAALAVPELVNHDAAKAILAGWPFFVKSGEPFSFAAFSLQVAAILFVAVLIGLLVRLIDTLRRWWQRRRGGAVTRPRADNRPRGGEDHV